MSGGSERTARLSIIDRLIDYDPGVGDATMTWAQSVAALKRSVLRDLEWLLNTRRIAELAPDRYVEVQRSVYHYGLPDVTAWSADSPDAHISLAREMEDCIRLFEPRLANVRVTVRPSEEKTERRARFSIDAMLRLEPNPERVVFDTVLDTTSGTIHVEAGDDA